MASETIALVDDLVKAKMPKKTATQLVDFIEKHQSQELKNDLMLIKKDVAWLRWGVGVLAVLLVGLTSLTVYLHSDLKSEIRINKQDIRSNKQDIQLIKQDIQSVKQDVQSVKQDIQSVKQDMQSVKQDVAEIKALLRRR